MKFDKFSTYLNWLNFHLNYNFNLRNLQNPFNFYEILQNFDLFKTRYGNYAHFP